MNTCQYMVCCISDFILSTICEIIIYLDGFIFYFSFPVSLNDEGMINLDLFLVLFSSCTDGKGFGGGRGGGGFKGGSRGGGSFGGSSGSNRYGSYNSANKG